MEGHVLIFENCGRYEYVFGVRMGFGSVFEVIFWVFFGVTGSSLINCGANVVEISNLSLELFDEFEV